MYSLDERAFRAVNDLTGSGGFVDGLSVFLARWLIFLMAAVVIAVAVRGLRDRTDRAGRRKAAREIAVLLRTSVAALGAVVDGMVLSLLVFRARPFVVLSDVNQLIDAPFVPKSFPSDHAAMSFAVAVSVAVLHPRLGLLFVPAAAGVALGRVLVGVHFPGDVLAGAALGALWALVVAYVGNLLGDVGRLERMLGRRTKRESS